jgi:hypothetical protein
VPGAPVSAALSAQGVASSAADDPPVYTASCTSSDGGAPADASGTASPVVVTGLTNGATYTCVVSTVVGRTVYTSAASATFVPDGAIVPTDQPAAAPALAFTGAEDPVPLVVVGLGLTMLGLAALSIGRRARPRSRRVT